MKVTTKQQYLTYAEIPQYIKPEFELMDPIKTSRRAEILSCAKTGSQVSSSGELDDMFDLGLRILTMAVCRKSKKQLSKSDRGSDITLSLIQILPFVLTTFRECKSRPFVKCLLVSLPIVTLLVHRFVNSPWNKTTTNANK